jgi:hypothetical protein
MLDMSKVIDNIRRYQKMIVLGVAMGVIALYMTPLDQIMAQTGRDSGAIDAARATMDTAFSNAITSVQNQIANIGSDRAYSIIDYLNARHDAANLRVDAAYQILQTFG